MTKKNPDSTDIHVGSRVRMRRMMLGMSQEKLAAGLGLTFPQVQKYEKATNRIGASRLQQIAHILRVGVSFFCEGARTSPASPLERETRRRHNNVSDFLATTDDLTIAKAFTRIGDAKLRCCIVAGIEPASRRRTGMNLQNLFARRLPPSRLTTIGQYAPISANGWCAPETARPTRPQRG